MNDANSYPGRELELFREAKNWKRYFSSVIRPYIKGDVLENGAGIGGTTLLLHNPAASSWVLAEPDSGMAAQLEELVKGKSLPANCSVHHGTIDTVKGNFDSIIYIDVLEHIEDDSAEIIKAAGKLNIGGHIVVLSPAFNFLFSPFDKEIGHYRRYSGHSLKKLTVPGLKLDHLGYYDTMGFFAALMNKLFLRQRYPTKKQVRFWDRFLVPISKATDILFFRAFGKAVIAIWRKES